VTFAVLVKLLTGSGSKRERRGPKRVWRGDIGLGLGGLESGDEGADGSVSCVGVRFCWFSCLSRRCCVGTTGCSGLVDDRDSSLSDDVVECTLLK
jgi:hypothetical protein